MRHSARASYKGTFCDAGRLTTESMDLAGFKMPPKPTPALRRQSFIQATAYDIAKSFGEQDRLGPYLATVKRVGPARARMAAAEVLADGARNLGALWLWKLKKRPEDDLCKKTRP